MKYRNIRAAAAATKRYADNVTHVAIILRGGSLETRVISAGNWLQPSEPADKIIYAKCPMSMAEIEAELDGVPYQTPQARYDSSNTTQIVLKLNRKTDADILDKLGTVGNRQGYIKALIRADLAR